MSLLNPSADASEEAITQIAEMVTDALTLAYITAVIRDLRLTPSEIERLFNDKKRFQGQMRLALSDVLQRISGVNISTDRRFSTPDPVGHICQGFTKM